MCGIAGTANIDGKPVNYGILKAMTDSISHRGPDGEGHWIEESFGIGHRRLSIIDLSSFGDQPMISQNKRFILSYNGEIYNYKELKIELQTLGYEFFSDTDTEVVLNSFIEWGDHAIKKFNGMFALALWDRTTKILTLVRDRYGIKPLYYSKHGSTFSFASEQKAITSHPDFHSSLNKSCLIEYFTFQNIFTNQTLLNDINILEAGHYLKIDLSNKNSIKETKKQYWDYNFREPNIHLDNQEYLEELDRLFVQAVKRQLVGDVELGAYLSGGMDSGSITAIASQEFSNLKSFTCGFDMSSATGIELSFDERNKAEAMSALFKTEHYEMVLKSGDMERCLTKLAWNLEEPRVGQSYPNFYAAQLASKFVKVVLSGSGGDELFGGYPWRYYRAAKSQNFEDYIDGYYQYWQRLVDNNQIKRIFNPVWKDVEHVWTKDIFQEVFDSHDNSLNRPEDYINHSLYFEAKTFLHGLFVVEDKLSMAHSLENRVPFMDNDLVDFAMSCPVNLKINNLGNVLRINENETGDKPSIYFEKTNDGKQILRDMMSNHIPKNITKMEKQGFSSPDASWFKGESIDFVRKSLLNKDARLYQTLDYDSVKPLIEEHLHGKANRRLLIWSLLNVNTWMDIYL